MKARDIPNLLCLLRMALVIPVVWAILEGRYPLALVLFFVAGFTDGLDGFLAKRFGWQSRLGALLDPAADKLLLVSAFAALWYTAYVPDWLLAAVVLRDLVIVSGAALYQWRVGGFEADPSPVSKLNSVLQLLYVLMTLGLLSFGIPARGLIDALGWLVLATTVVSGFDYVIRWTLRARAERA